MSLLSALQNLYWREPLWLLLALQPLLILLIKKTITKNNRALYADKNLQPWVVFPKDYSLSNMFFSKNTSYILAWLFLSIALAGPRAPLSLEDKTQLIGANIMLVVDLSRSMKAMDVSPNRLRRAKIEVYELLEKAQEHRIGITVYSARPHLFVPLTYDHKILKTYLDSLEDLTFPTLGSDAITAIMFAQKELIEEKGTSSIILITDGDFPDITKEQSNLLQKANIPLFVLGVGSTEGEAIQTEDGTWLKYKQQDVVSRMNQGNLEQLARHLNGKYSPVYDDDTDWESLYTKGIAKHNTLSNIDIKQHILWQENFQYFLFPSILLFWFSLSSYRFRDIKKRNVLAIFIICLFSIPEKSVYAFQIELGQTAEQSAFRAYKNKKFSQAEKTYRNINGYVGKFGQGNSLYKMGHYKKAIQQFVSAILSAKTDTQRASALYNLANSYFRTGQFSSAIMTYKDVLRYQPDNKACLYNINISQALIKNIEQRLIEKEKIMAAYRQGRGVRSERVANSTEINENTSVSMGDDDNKINTDIPLPELPNIDKDTLKKLIISGLENIEFAEQGNSKTNLPKQNNSLNIDLLNVQQQTTKINNNQHLLWKRVFEIEEGFPAPVDERKTLPGVKPW